MSRIWNVTDTRHIRTNDNRDMAAQENYLLDRIACLQREVKRLTQENIELQQCLDQSLEIINGHAVKVTHA